MTAGAVALATPRMRQKGPSMRTLIVSEFISLDGVVEAPGGEQTHPQQRTSVGVALPM
jgi:hypothetical protein